MKKTLLAMLCLAVFSCERDKEPVHVSLLKHEGSSTVETRSAESTGGVAHEFECRIVHQSSDAYDEACRQLRSLVNKVSYYGVTYQLSGSGTNLILYTLSNELNKSQLESAAEVFFSEVKNELSRIPGIVGVMINHKSCSIVGSLGDGSGGGGGGTTNPPGNTPKMAPKQYTH